MNYGIYSIKSTSIYTHRLAWELANGQPVPDGKWVLHRCHTRLCCNPDHLYVGDHWDNMADLEASGRRRGRPRIFTEIQVRELKEFHQHGATLESLARLLNVGLDTIARAVNDHSSALVPMFHRTPKLSDEQIAEARQRVTNGESMRSVARHLGVSGTTIQRVVHGQARYKSDYA